MSEMRDFGGASTLLSNTPFFERTKPQLQNLFQVLGHCDEWSESFSKVLSYTQAAWVNDSPWNLDTDEKLSISQQQNARALLSEIGVIEAVEVNPGHYDQVIVLGAMARANNARTKFVADRMQTSQIDVNKGQLIFWGGPRARVPKEEEPLATLISDLPVSVNNNPWLRNQLSNTNDAERPFNDETAGGRLAFLKHFGAMRLTQAYLDVCANDRLMSRYYLQPEATDAEIVIMNARSVARSTGKPRHTTEQCAQEWLDELPPKRGARVLMVVNNPSIERTTKVVQAVIESKGRGDIQFVTGGPAAYEDLAIGGALAEVGRLLYMDHKQITA